MYITESDTRAQYIDPKLKESGWDKYVHREYYFTDGRKLLGGKRGKRLFVDYLLRYKNTNLAIIEAKKLGKHPTDGLQQAIAYAEKLKVKFVFATNGEKIYQFDMKTGTGDYIDNFPEPETLFHASIENLTSLKTQLLGIPFYMTGDKMPRYYQEIAVNKAIEAIADDKKRILLTLATGTGKTSSLFKLYTSCCR